MNIGTPAPEEKKSVGIIIGIVIIVLLLAFGAYYFLKKATVDNPGSADTSYNTASQSDQVAAALSAQGTSTDLDAIQKDLNATDYSRIDAGLNDVTI